MRPSSRICVKFQTAVRFMLYFREWSPTSRWPSLGRPTGRDSDSRSWHLPLVGRWPPPVGAPYEWLAEHSHGGEP
jgi:hypothetical protein